ncbi:MAG: histidine triad nucleotide-binding protein [Rhodobacteraceae bacterium]|nr:histidine triad nucleotide-binding protein [Paracoccaceae bacterium]
MSDSKTLFQKIISRELPADIVYEDDEIISFRDINPQAPFHILVCPKEPITMLSKSSPNLHRNLLGNLLIKSAEIAAEEGYKDKFRIVINNGVEAGQSVFHLHVHVLAGRQLDWPPG